MIKALREALILMAAMFGGMTYFFSLRDMIVRFKPRGVMGKRPLLIKALRPPGACNEF